MAAMDFEGEDNIPDLMEFYDAQMEQGKMIPMLVQHMESVSALLQQMLEAQAQVIALQQQIVEGQQAAAQAITQALAKPRDVRLGGIERGPEGMVVGASAKVQ